MPLAIVAISGRALAQSAVRAGCAVTVLDAFADRDAHAVASVHCIRDDFAIALDPDRMLRVLDALPEPRRILAGSGFERHPEWLDALARHGTLFANDADLVRALKDPTLSTELLRALDFPVPDVSREPPPGPEAWLQKEIGGAGGVHVRDAIGAVHRGDCYYQRRVAGRPLSMTFLADGERCRVLGYNEQGVGPIGESPYAYLGAVTLDAPPAVAQAIEERLARLVRLTGLRGLNGLDFMLDGDDWQVLEINPRPPATFDLYDDRVEGGLVQWHLRSFSESIEPMPRLSGENGGASVRIVFAGTRLRIPAGVVWPVWCADLPADGGLIPAGWPVLSVYARAKPATVRPLLDERVAAVEQLLAGWCVEEETEDAG
jgi:predicted ATP-grasp superfamily ATP-dependent carboligase